MKSQALRSQNTKLDEAFVLIETKHPHIGNAINVFWGNPEFVGYMSNLFFDTRDGQRRGFDYEVVKALNCIHEVHDETFPHLVKNTTDIWSVNHTK